MNQGKLEVVKQEMARLNTDNLGISKIKWKEEKLKVKEKRKDWNAFHLNAELQGIARRDKKAFSVINAKKYRKTIEWESRCLQEN